MNDQYPPSPYPAPAPRSAAPVQYPCAGCGARVEFAPGTTTLRCPYCGFTQQITAATAQISERDYAAWAALPPKPRARLREHESSCRNCGASVQSDDLSGACPFCGSPVVVEVAVDEQIAPEGVVPFAVDQRAAQDAVRTWIHSRWFAPNRLRKVGGSETMKGTYLPFWTFDAQTASDYRGQRGEHYLAQESYTDGEGRSQTRQVQRTAWYPRSGRVSRWFDDVLVPGTGQLPADRLQEMGPWRTEEAVPYQPDYLSGFRTLRYDIEPDAGLEAAKKQMAEVIEQDCRDDIGGDVQRVDSVRTDYRDITFKLLLMPVWIAAYLYGGKTFQVLVNAHTGQVVGARPYSWIKITLTVIGVFLALVTVLTIIELVKQNR